MQSNENAPPPPRLPNLTSGGKSMAAIGDLVSDLVDRMEVEAAQCGAISHESASKLRNLRRRAEQLFWGAAATTIRE